MFIRIVQAITDAGLWNGEQRNGLSILATFSIFCFLGVYILQLIALVLALDDPERLFECFSVISFCGMGILKLCSLQLKSQTWLKLLEQISELEENPFKNISVVEYDSEDEDQPNNPFKGEKNHVEKFEITFTLLRRTYQFTAVIYILSPFIEYGFRSLLGDKPSQFPHILPCWSPLEDDVHFFWYVVMIILETIAAEYCVFVHIAYDLTVIGIMMFICVKCTVLFDQCARIGGRGRNCSLSWRRDKRAHYRIIVCHKIHILLVNAISELNNLIKNILGVYFMLSTLTLCSVALQLKAENISVMKIASLLQFTCATLTQLYLFCTYGDAVLNTSSINMGEGPYASAICCLSPKIRKEILLLGVGMSKPRQLQAGPFNVVNLSSFIMIVRAAYSCYAVVGK